MAISAWWLNRPAERFWMETVSRPDLGTDLRAPQSGEAGREVPHYALVPFVQPGDIIFHWHTGRRPSALVGWSEAVGPLTVEDDAWTPHAGSGASLPSTPEPHWVMPLGGITLLDRPIDGADLLPWRSEILAIGSSVTDSSRAPAYFPFDTYGSDGLRAHQGYLSKMPAALVELLDLVGSLELAPLSVAGDLQIDEALAAPGTPRRRMGYQSDARRRRSIELHAVDRAIELYRAEGATDITVLGKPYDLLVRFGRAERHVEVKGSSGPADAVLVTRNEVKHARDTETDLVVVDRIVVGAAEDGAITTSGGRTRRWRGWVPVDAQLSPTAFECDLPEEPELFKD